MEVLDRTKALHGPRTQAFGETNHSTIPGYQPEPRYCMVLGHKPMGKLDTYRRMAVLDGTRALHGARTQASGETNHSNMPGYQTEPRYCMVLGLKPMGKLDTYRRMEVLDRAKALHGARIQSYGKTRYLQKNGSVRQNQGLAWSPDSSRSGN
nr:hypothetical protein CFP56_26744 [Quercus suber]